VFNREKLIAAAKKAKESNSFIYILKNGSGIELAVLNTYSTEQVATNADIIKVLQHENILKHDWSTWEQSDVSIKTLVDSINKKYA
jgi:hypothetical protein